MKSSSKAILIFDIGKTNKKAFLFDKDWNVLYTESKTFEEIPDPDGHMGDDLQGIVDWVKNTIDLLLKMPKIKLVGINFSAYGASLVHIDKNGKPATPFYNYTKEFPYSLYQSFIAKFGSEGKHMLETGSPGVGMINSGYQLYWLKYHRPEAYKKIRTTIHLPQYLSYAVTGVALSDYTSVGCHTGMWHYAEHQYHPWIIREKFDEKLAPLVKPPLSILTKHSGKELQIGIGIHDSSAALLPYLSSLSEPFILVSTGTWCVSINPFNKDLITAKDMTAGCLHYMQPDGLPVLAHRLFLGHELEYQTTKLAHKFEVSISSINKIKYQAKLDYKIQRNFKRQHHFTHLGEEEHLNIDQHHQDLTRAYHQLMAEIVSVQIKSIRTIVKKSPIRRIIIDGGFAKNKVYLQMLSNRMQNFEIYKSDAALGSALGAAISLKPSWWSNVNFNRHFGITKIKPKLQKKKKHERKRK